MQHFASHLFALTAFAGLLLASCTSREPSPFGSLGTIGAEREYGDGTGRRLRARGIEAEDRLDNSRRKYVVVVVTDFGAIERTGFMQRRFGGGIESGGGRIAGTFDCELWRETDNKTLRYPCQFVAWGWNDYYFNNGKHVSSEGRLFVWTIDEKGEAMFRGPFPLLGALTPSRDEIWQALDAALPEYKPRG